MSKSDELRPGLELLQYLANYPTRGVHLGRHTVNQRIVLIHRDANGRVIGSTERIEESTFTDQVGDWIG